MSLVAIAFGSRQDVRMRTLVPLLALSTSALLLTSLYLGSQLQSERARASREAERASKALAELDDLSDSHERLEREAEALRGASTSVSAAREPAAVSAVMRGTLTGSVVPPGALSGTPAFRPPELTAEQRNSMVRRRYGALLRELGLSPSEIEALVPVLAAQDRATGMWRQLSSNGAEPRPDPEKNRAEIAAIIGPEKATQLERLKATLPARSQLSVARMQLDEAGIPMTDAQRAKLLEIMNAHEPPPALTRSDGETPDQTMARLAAAQDEREQRFREDAASVLTPQQQKELADIADVQRSFRRSAPLGMQGAAGSPGVTAR